METAGFAINLLAFVAGAAEYAMGLSDIPISGEMISDQE
jgi:hypothetical protein